MEEQQTPLSQTLTCHRPRWWGGYCGGKSCQFRAGLQRPGVSSINRASSHPLGVEKDSTALFERLPIETESPALGSIQNALVSIPSTNAENARRSRPSQQEIPAILEESRQLRIIRRLDQILAFSVNFHFLRSLSSMETTFLATVAFIASSTCIQSE